MIKGEMTTSCHAIPDVNTPQTISGGCHRLPVVQFEAGDSSSMSLIDFLLVEDAVIHDSPTAGEVD